MVTMPLRIDIRDLQASQTSSLDQHIIHTDLDTFLFIQKHTQLQHSVHSHCFSHVVVRNSGFRLQKTIGNHFAHIGQRDLLVRILILTDFLFLFFLSFSFLFDFLFHLLRGLLLDRLGLLGLGAGGIMINIVFDNSFIRSSALHITQINILFRGKFLG